MKPPVPLLPGERVIYIGEVGPTIRLGDTLRHFFVQEKVGIENFDGEPSECEGLPQRPITPAQSHRSHDAISVYMVRWILLADDTERLDQNGGRDDELARSSPGLDRGHEQPIRPS